MPDAQPEPFICVYYGDPHECLLCGGYVGKTPIVLTAGVDSPISGRYCTTGCADEAIEFALAATARATAWRDYEDAWYAAWCARNPQHQAELDAWNGRTDVEWAIPNA